MTHWLKDGDANMGYFHTCLKNKGKRSSIMALLVQAHWVHDVTCIWENVVNFFFNQFFEPNIRRPMMEGFEFTICL